MGRLTASFYFSAFSLLIWLRCNEVLAISTDDTITCWYYDGAAAENNTQCPGSNACCGYAATCLSNRLCHNPGDDAGTYVRGPCAIYGWDSECAQICLYDETTGVFPRATQCDDGSWCCNNNSKCCDQGAGVFLDATGATATTEAAYTISYPPASGTSTGRITVGSSVSTSASTSTSSTSSTASATSTTIASDTTASAATAATTSRPSATSTAATSSQSATSDSSTSSLALPVGLGVGLGVPLVAILSGGVVWMLLRRKRAQRDHPPGSPSQSPGSSPSAHHALIAQHQFMTEKQRQNAIELNSYDPRLEASFARNRHELPTQHESVAEMP